MTMEIQNLINGAFAFIMAVGGWLAREVWEAVKDLRADLHDIETNLPREYVLKIDLDKRMEHIEHMFQRIYDKLDTKLDR